MKKILLIALSITFVLALLACSSIEDNDIGHADNDTQGIYMPNENNGTQDTNLPSDNNDPLNDDYSFPRLINHNHRGRAFPLYFDLIQRDNFRLEFYVLHPHPDPRGAERIAILRYNEKQSFESSAMHLIHKNGYTYLLSDDLPQIFHVRQEDEFWHSEFISIPEFDELILFTGFGVTTFNGVPHEFEEYLLESGWTMQFLFDKNDELVLIRNFWGSRFLGIEDVVIINIDWDLSESDFEIPADYREFCIERDGHLIGLDR